MPLSLNWFNCDDNEINQVENLPLSLIWFKYYGNDVVSVDNTKFSEINFRLKSYTNFKRIQLRIKRNKRRLLAALTIQKGLYNWVFKAVCKDGSYGINFRIGLKHLQEEGLLSI